MMNIEIETLDNPGWFLSHYLEENDLVDRVFTSYGNSDEDSDWFSSSIIGNKLYISGDPRKLNAILNEFARFLESRTNKSQTPLLEKELAHFLEDWYVPYCDGDWEHLYGLKLSCNEIGQWTVIVDLEGTYLEDTELPPSIESVSPYHLDRNEYISKFMATGKNLNELIAFFRKWALENKN